MGGIHRESCIFTSCAILISRGEGGQEEVRFHNPLASHLEERMSRYICILKRGGAIFSLLFDKKFLIFG